MGRDRKDEQGWSVKMQRKAALVTVGAGLLLSACNPHPLKPASISHTSAGNSSVALEVDKQLDVLFVIDNSGSMAEEQAKLAANFAPFIETLDAAGADYRIAVTTTDDGGFGCFGQPESGRFVATSCLDRPEDFGSQELFESTCAANCSYTTEQLGFQPSAAAAGDDLAPRPWIQGFAGEDNLAEGVSTLDAFQCLAPQGISGCGYERTLESMSQALGRSGIGSEEEHGFLRPGANLLVVIVTDEADCSYNERFEDELFNPNYGQTFFEPNFGLPSSAICWNAGVACVEGAQGYESCSSVELGVDGQPTSVVGASMLSPVTDYVDALASLASDREVMVSVIAGVPLDYGEGAPIHYAESDDPQISRNFGIGYGCTSGEGEQLQWAIPPVRLEEFASAFAGDRQNLFSVCADDYTPALEVIVDSVLAEFGPACFEGCLADSDPLLEGVQASCQIIEVAAESGDESLLEPCAFDGQAFALPEGLDACYILRDDMFGSTPSEADDLALECQVAGQNAQFELIRREGVAVEPGTEVRAECELSAFPSVDCPGA